MRNLVLAAVAALAPLAAAAEEVRVFNWSDYIDESVLKSFEEETGIKVVYDVFDSNEVLETKLLAGGSGYDVVVPSGSFLARQIRAGVFQKLDAEKIPNIGNAWDVVKKRTAAFDPGNAFSVNYLWGTTGIGINTGKVKEVLGEDAPTDSWALVFDPKNMEKLASCGVFFLDAPSEIIPAALSYIGEDAESIDPDVLKKAEEPLMAVRPHIRKFHSSEYINALANGEICVAIGWSGDIFQARDRAAEAENGVEIEYIIPKEGAMMWFDQMAIPADAKNVEAAHKFINHILKPEVAAAASNYVFYANGNLPAQKLLEKEVFEDPAVYPDQATLDKLFTAVTYPKKALRVMNRMFTKVKSGQ